MLNRAVRRKDWLTPFGVFLSLLLTITTAEFKDTLNIGKETWKAFFFILLIASVLWLVYSLICWFKFRHQGNIDTFIKNITESKQSPQAAASETTKAPDVQNQN